ncbi:MAG TPA: leucyl aminopeptidase [Pyrinomonadaceae bacterium]|jgi:leucyl aminopeptidase|nr:leucyl aminopeptidase [Pyrinomonadaceae bacterium]
MQIEGSNGHYRDLDVQALAIAVFKGEKADEGFLKELDELTDGLVSSSFEFEEFSGKDGETAYFHLLGKKSLKATRLLLIGAGAKENYKSAQLSALGGTATRALRSKGIKSLAIVPRSESDAENVASTVTEGALMGLFDPDKYRTVDKEKREIDKLLVSLAGADEGAISRGTERGRIVGESVNFTRDMANEPGAYLTPTDMADRAREMATEFGLNIDVLDEARMEQEGMGSLLSVSRGSDEPAKLIILKYTPAEVPPGSDDGLLAFVGKGITFDSGGISLKPGENMELMKYDMTGGATVIGALRAVAQLKPPIPVLGVAACSENLPSGKATKPGDVVRAMTGKTIEVINTDAEGRLVLADAIAYAKKLGATTVVDLATLTGAVSIALGDVHAAILGTNQELIDEVIAAGKDVGEKFWQLPLDAEYSRQIKSDIADIKNVGGRKGGTITAAAFLKEFAEGLSWAHLDIAGTAWAEDPKPHRAKGPTGIAVRTLIRMVERASRAKADGESLS